MAALSPSAVSALRQEIQEYMRCGERLLLFSGTPDYTPLSPMERQVLQYYLEELHDRLLQPQATP